MPGRDISTEEALRFVADGMIRCGVPIANAIRAYELKPCHLTLHTVIMACTPNLEADQQQIDYLTTVPASGWPAAGDWTAEQIREATLANLRRNIGWRLAG